MAAKRSAPHVCKAASNTTGYTASHTASYAASHAARYTAGHTAGYLGDRAHVELAQQARQHVLSGAGRGRSQQVGSRAPLRVDKTFDVRYQRLQTVAGYRRLLPKPDVPFLAACRRRRRRLRPAT